MTVSVITTAYLIFWGPLFLVTLVNWDWDYEEAKQSMAHEVTLHVAFVHAFVNPSLLMVLHRGIRQARHTDTLKLTHTHIHTHIHTYTHTHIAQERGLGIIDFLTFF